MDPLVERIVEAYLRLSLHVLKYGRIRLTEVVEGLGPEEEDVMAALLSLGSGTVDEIAEKVREMRGSCSRNTVRKRLRSMLSKGLVEAEKSGKRVLYRPTRAVLISWLRFLGIKLEL